MDYNSINILILSVGTRNKIVQYFKQELNGQGKVFAADASPLAPALYDADYYYIIPKLNDNSYLNEVLKICKENKIDAVLSLIDPELLRLAKNRQAFETIGTTPIVSSTETIELFYDKYQMMKALVNKQFNTIKSFMSIANLKKAMEQNVVTFPVFVKPVSGSASLNINKVHTMEQLTELFKHHENLMIQEFIDGKEYGIDVYVDMQSKEMSAMFIKEKLLMRAGETDKSVSLHKKELFNYVKKFVEAFDFVGPIDVDVFERNGQYLISEVNPRFGGGYPHAHACGVNFIKAVIDNLNQKTSTQSFDYDIETYMLKYNEIKIL